MRKVAPIDRHWGLAFLAQLEAPSRRLLPQATTVPAAILTPVMTLLVLVFCRDYSR